MNWHYLSNQFDNVTKNSNLRMVIITNDHNAKLIEQQADPDILDLLNRTTPVHEDYLKAYNDSKSAVAFRKSATQSVTEKLGTLRSTTLRQWDAQVQVHYLSGSAEYTAIFPNGLTAFHTSTMDQTVTMLKALADRMNVYAPLAAVATEVETFHTDLKDLRDKQQGKEQLVGQTATLLEEARFKLATLMYANLGILMDKYASAPDNIANFWEVQLLQQHTSANNGEPETEEFSGNVEPLSTVNITSNIEDDSTVVLSNTGSVTLVFCTAADGATACGVAGLSLAPGEVLQATGAELNGGGSFLNVTNNDPATEGAYNVEIQLA
jgi:hypothetical protein